MEATCAGNSWPLSSSKGFEELGSNIQFSVLESKTSKFVCRSNSSFCGWGLLFLVPEEMEMVNFHPWERILEVKLFVHILCRFTTQTTKSSFPRLPQVPFSNLESTPICFWNSSHSPRPTSGKYAAQNKVPTPCYRVGFNQKLPQGHPPLSWLHWFFSNLEPNTCFSVIASDPTPIKILSIQLLQIYHT